MHLTWLVAHITPLLPTMTSYLPLRATVVKSILYDPLLGLLHQTVWGLVGTSYWGDPLTCSCVQHCQHFGARRRARWQVESSQYVLNFCTSIMDTIKLIPPQCFSHAKPLDITREFADLLSKFTYDGEGKVAWLEYLEDFYAEEASVLIAYTLCESPLRWC